MGIFSFFKKKPAPAPEPEIKCTVEITHSCMVRKVEKYAHLKGVEAFKPNKYGNYYYPPCAFFTVKGTNPKTGRQNTKRYEATGEQDAEEKAISIGLVPPFTISWEPLSDPSEAQMNYANDAGISVPAGACSGDVSALLTRFEKDDDNPATQGFLEYLASKGWCYSSLIGYKEMLWQAVEREGTQIDVRERIALYAYCAVQSSRGIPAGNILTDKRKVDYFKFADEVMADDKLMKSYKRIGYLEYAEPEKHMAIYQAVKKRFL